MNWTHKDVWTHRGEHFCVEVSRHDGYSDHSQGKNRWCVYAYIYPEHPHFAAFSGTDMFQSAASIMPLHCGPSFIDFPQSDGVVTCVKVGADYNHLHDDRYTFCDTREDACSVFYDAEKLFAWLEKYEVPA